MTEPAELEKQLVTDCLNGVKPAQKRLYDLYAWKMMAVCMRYCKDRETAMDLLHDGFLKVFTHLDSYRGSGSLEGWIRRIMVNTSLEYLRHRNDEGFQMDVEEAYGLTNGEMGALERMETDELIRCIQQLPDAYRTVFNLFVVEGYSHKEIADTMHITESSSRVYLTRAKQQLQQLLSNVR